MQRERGFGWIHLIVLVSILAALVVYGKLMYGFGVTAERAEREAERAMILKIAFETTEQLGRALLRESERRIEAEQRATQHENNWKETLREIRRSGKPLGSCPEPRSNQGQAGAASPVGGSVAGPGLRAPRVSDGGATGPRVHWNFVGLFDGAFTGLDGKPVFAAQAEFAGAPERSDTASPYGLEDVIEVHGANSSDYSRCLRWVDDVERKLKAAEAAWERKQP